MSAIGGTRLAMTDTPQAPRKIRQKLVSFEPEVYEQLVAALEKENAHPAVKAKMDMDTYINRMLRAAIEARQAMKEEAA